MIAPRWFALCAVMLVATSALAELVGENLVVRVPAGYKIDFEDRQKDAILSEMVPVNESVKDWTEMITVQSFLGTKGVTPEQLKSRIVARWFAGCAGSQTESVSQGVQNGYPTAVWLLVCPKNSETGKTEMTWFKAIQGNDSLYVVQKAFKFRPSQEQIAEWTRYLQTATVCDSRLPDRPCPAVTR
jgi:hypothetical protein